jgi:hypothetical protein
MRPHRLIFLARTVKTDNKSAPKSGLSKTWRPYQRFMESFLFLSDLLTTA